MKKTTFKNKSNLRKAVRSPRNTGPQENIRDIIPIGEEIPEEFRDPTGHMLGPGEDLAERFDEERRGTPKVYGERIAGDVPTESVSRP